MAQEEDDKFAARGDYFGEEDDDDIEEIEEEDEESDGDEGDSEDDDDSEDYEDSDGDGGDDDEEEEEEVTPPRKEPRIPKSRFDEINSRMKEANERNLWLEEQLEKLINQGNSRQPATQTPTAPPAPTYDYDAAEEQYISLIIEGEVGKASKLRNEINANRQIELKALIDGIESKSSEQVKSQSQQLMEKERFEASINTMETKYPFLNNKDKAYNEEAVETVNTLLAGYLATGKGKVESLQLAISKVLPLYEKKGSKTSLSEQRKTEAGKKAAIASRQQPSKTKSSNSKTSDMGKVDVSRMTDRDFAKLTAKEKSILRGD